MSGNVYALQGQWYKTPDIENEWIQQSSATLSILLW